MLDPKQLSFGPVAETEPTISPDGRWIAFQYFPRNRPQTPLIWIMEVSKGFSSAKPLVDHLGYAAELSWSPDSKWVSFISSDNMLSRKTEQIYKVNVVTTEVVQVTAFPEGTLIGDSTAWSASGLIAFEKDGEICGVPDVGGEEVRLLDTRIALSSRRPSYIRFSPDGRMLLFSVETGNQDQSEIWVAELRSQTFRRLTSLHFDLFPAWIDEEHVLFSRETENGRSEVQALSLRTGNVERLTRGHVDFTPSTDSSGSILYFSRKGRVPKQFEMAGLLVGFHIWCVPVNRKLLQ